MDTETLIKKYGFRPVAPGMPLYFKENGKKILMGDAVAHDPDGLVVKYFTLDMLMDYDRANSPIEPTVTHDDGQKKGLKPLQVLILKTTQKIMAGAKDFKLEASGE